MWVRVEGWFNRVWHKGRGHESIRSDTGLSARLQAFQLTSLSSSTTLLSCLLSISSPSILEGINGLVGVVGPLLILKQWTSSSVRIRLVHESCSRSAHTSSLVIVTKYWLRIFTSTTLSMSLGALLGGAWRESRPGVTTVPCSIRVSWRCLMRRSATLLLR